jgi:hypothetical protein
MAELETLRARSSAVFGNRYMAEVVGSVVRLAPSAGSAVTIRMLAMDTGLADSLVRPVIKRLVDADLLRPRRRLRPRGTNHHEVIYLDGVWEALVMTCALLGRER